jgi:hypothetical protein
MSNLLNLDKNYVEKFLIDYKLSNSNYIKKMLLFLEILMIFWAASSVSFLFLQAIIIVAFLLASSIAVSNPNPVLQPVIITIFP